MRHPSFWDSVAYGFTMGLFNNSWNVCCPFNNWWLNYNNSGLNCFVPRFNCNSYNFSPSMFMNTYFNPFPVQTFPQTNFFNLPAMTNNNMSYKNETFSTVFPKITDNQTTVPAFFDPIDNSKVVKESKNETATHPSFASEHLPQSKNAQELKQRWTKKDAKPVSISFCEKVIETAKRLNCSPDDLMALMYSESKFDTKARNKWTRATGLIQFMPNTAKGELNTTVDEIYKMTMEQQLELAERYLMKAKGYSGYSKSDRIDVGTLYALTFLPANSKKENLAYSYSKEYKLNEGLDYNKDGVITKTDLANRLKSYYA